MDDDSEVVMAAIFGLCPHQFADLVMSLDADLRLRQRRLLQLILSPPRFAAALSRLRDLSLSDKTRLLARLLLRSLRPFAGSAARPSGGAAGLRDLDAGILLLFLCENYDGDLSWRPGSDWYAAVAAGVAKEALCLRGLGVPTVARHVHLMVSCRRLLAAVSGGGGCAAPASAAAVVALPSVEGEGACAVCWEEMAAGRDACELPCGHLFHWCCILPWLRKTNTCPCCRFQLPSDDVLCEAHRLWHLIAARAAAAAPPLR